MYKSAKEESRQAEESVRVAQKECEELNQSLKACKLEMVALKKKWEEREERNRTREERLQFVGPPAVPLRDKEVESQLRELSAYKFTNQLLIQQLAEERKKASRCRSAEEVKRIEKENEDLKRIEKENEDLKRIKKENEDLKKEVMRANKKMEEMKKLIDKMDKADLEYIDDSSEEV